MAKQTKERKLTKVDIELIRAALAKEPEMTKKDRELELRAALAKEPKRTKKDIEFLRAALKYQVWKEASGEALGL